MDVKKLLHYEIIDKLGEGGMGEVYRAHDTKLHRDVAIKVIPEHLAGDADRLKRFKREASVVASLNHPNIVTVYAIEEVDGMHFLVMELVEGKTLSEHIPAKGIALDQLFKIAVPLTDAIHSAHAKGIAHRDLKPANIMIDVEGRVKVLDFGLAKLIEVDVASDETVGATSLTGVGRVMGTAAYMSPEQAEGKTIDNRSDIFSLGIILHEMATGVRPFQGDTYMSTLSSIIKDDPASVIEIRPTLPVHLGRIVKRCLAKNPDRRYQASLDIRNELEGLQDELSSGEFELPLASQSQPNSAVTKRAAIWGGGLLALILLAVFFWPTLKGGERSSGRENAESARVQDTPIKESAELNSIAVLPFINMSGDPDNEYFSDGLAEEMLNLLSRVQGLHVAARTSSFHFKGQTGVMQEIGERLNVATVLEGSVRRVGNRVRITAQLIKTDDGFQLWSETYDRQLDDVFGIQEEIAIKVVEAMKLTLLGEDAEKLAKRPTENIGAYDAYLRGQQQLALRNSVALTEAAVQFQLAIDLDPTMAAAYAGRARALILLTEYGTRTIDENKGVVPGLLDKAMSLDDQLGEAHAVLGLWQANLFDFPGARASYERAIELNPNYAMSYLWYALAVGWTDTEKRGELMSKALELDPLSPLINSTTAFWNAFEGDVETALEKFQLAIDIDPEFSSAYAGLADIYSDHLDQPDEGIKWQIKAVQTDPGNLRRRVNLGNRYLSLGRLADSRRTFQETIAIDPGFAAAYLAMGELEKGRGHYEEAARWCRQGFEREPMEIVSIDAMASLCFDLDDLDGARGWINYAQDIEGSQFWTLSASYDVHIHRGQWDEASVLLDEMMNQSPAAATVEKIMLDLAMGRQAEARSETERLFPALFNEAPLVNRSTFGPATLAGSVLGVTGTVQERSALADAMASFLQDLSETERTNAYSGFEVFVLWLRGETDQALAALEKFVDTGRYGEWWKSHYPGYAFLLENPRGQQLFARMRAEVAEIRGRIPDEILLAPPRD